MENKFLVIINKESPYVWIEYLYDWDIENISEIKKIIQDDLIKCGYKNLFIKSLISL